MSVHAHTSYNHIPSNWRSVCLSCILLVRFSLSLTVVVLEIREQAKSTISFTSDYVEV